MAHRVGINSFYTRYCLGLIFGPYPAMLMISGSGIRNHSRHAQRTIWNVEDQTCLSGMKGKYPTIVLFQYCSDSK